MASIRRALFSSGAETSTIRCSNSAKPTEMSCKDSLSENCEQPADYIDVVVEEKGHVTKRVLVVAKTMAGAICKQLAGMPLLQDIPVVLSSLDNLSSVCSREKLALVFVDKCFDQNCIAEICSTIRFSSSSPNKTVAIIGVDASQDQESSTSCMGLTEVISLPFREEVINQLLLKYAGIIPYRDLPLTPESPDEDVAVARKAAEIIRQSEEQALLSEEMESTFNTHQDVPLCTTHSSSTSRFGSELLTDSNNIQFVRSSSDQNQCSARQPSLSDNNGMRSLGGKEDIRSVSYQGPMYNKEHSSWTISHNQISENISKNVMPIPITFTDHLNGTQANQEFQSQNENFNICQQNRQIPISQSRSHLHFPLPIAQESKAHQTSANSNHTTIQNQMSGPSQANVPSQVQCTSNSEADHQSSKMKVDEPSGGKSAYMVSGVPGSKDMKITMLPDDMSKHSSKERVRRERIKDSCDKLRCLLPNITGKKTDMASILEMTVQFVKLINERTPPQVMQEIADTLSSNTMGMCRKRTQKELHISKQKLMRVVHPPAPVSVPSPLISGDPQGHIIYPSYLSNNGPVFHSHPQHYGSNPHQYKQYIQGVSCGGAYSPLAKELHAGFIHSTHVHGINQGISSIPKDMPTIPSHVVKEPQMFHNYQPIHTDMNICHHRPLYGSPLAVSTSSAHSDMPQQWGFLKLPAISAISPCSSTCLSSSEDQDSRSNSSSTNDTSIDSPLWDDTKGTC